MSKSKVYSTPKLDELTMLLNQLGSQIRPNGSSSERQNKESFGKEFPSVNGRRYNAPPKIYQDPNCYHARPQYYEPRQPFSQPVWAKQRNPGHPRTLPIIPLARRRGVPPGGGPVNHFIQQYSEESRRGIPSKRRGRGGLMYQGVFREDYEESGISVRRRPPVPNYGRRVNIARGQPIEYNPMAVTIQPVRPKQVVGIHSSTKGWKLIINDNQRLCYASYLSGSFKKNTLFKWFNIVDSKVKWQNPKVETNTAQGMVNLLTRSVAWYASCQCIYSYSGVSLKPERYPSWLNKITKAVMGKLGMKGNLFPNCCLINYYPDGKGYVDWHSDREGIFIPKDEDNVLIISLSLGAPRIFELRYRKTRDERDVVKTFLRSGDLLTMEGQFQRHYVHRVPRDLRCSEPRINLTWRWIRTHESGCKLHEKDN